MIHWPQTVDKTLLVSTPEAFFLFWEMYALSDFLIMVFVMVSEAVT